MLTQPTRTPIPSGWLDRPEPVEPAIYHLGYPGTRTSGGFRGHTLGISPDGRTLLWTVRDHLGRWSVQSRQPGAMDPVTVLRAQQAPLYVVSPDNRSLLYLDDGDRLQQMPLTGGAPRLLTDGARFPAVWPEGGFIYFTTAAGQGAPARIRETGGTVEEIEIAGLPEGEVFILTDALPDGRGLLGMTGTGAAGAMVPAVVDLGTREVTRLDILGRTPRYAPPGYLLVIDPGGSIYAAPFDAKKLRVTGDPAPLVHDVRLVEEGDYAVSGEGSILFRRGAQESTTEIARIDRSGGVEILPHRIPWGASGRLSPDGGRLAYQARQGSAWNVHVLDLVTGTRSRLTFDGAARYPTWTPGGDSVVYYRNSGERAHDLWMEPATGAGQETLLLQTPEREIEVAFTDDPDRVVIRQGDRSRADASELWLRSRTSPEDAHPVADGPYSVRSPMVSPDGRWVAYVSDETGADQIFVRSIENPELKTSISDQGGIEPAWAWSGEEVFYRKGFQLVAVPVTTEPTFRITGEPGVLFDISDYRLNHNRTSYGVLPDDQGFIFFRDGGDEGVFLVQGWEGLLAGG